MYIRTWVNLEHIRKKEDWIDQMGVSLLFCSGTNQQKDHQETFHILMKIRFYFHFFSKIINILFLSGGPSFFCNDMNSLQVQTPRTI